MSECGALYLVTTPIGNLEDITLRALRILQEADLIAAEDTRHTRQLLSHYDIHTRLDSCHAFNEHRKVVQLIAQVKEGLRVALVSDAGTPSVADPGFLLVREAIASGIEPVVIPGVSALTFAVTASGLPVDKFAFHGFVPVKSGRKTKFLNELLKDDRTGFCFESPYRVQKTLDELAQLAPNVPVAVIREATKIHEEVVRGTAKEVAELNREWRGEFVIGVSPRQRNDESVSESD